MTIPLLPGRTRESGGVQFVVCKVQPTHTDEMPADRGVCGSPGASSQGCQNPGRGGEGRICHSEAAGTVCLCSVWVLYLHSQKCSPNLENVDIH